MIKKYFTEKQIYAATFFGGPIPAGILIYKNLKRIEEDKKASLTLILTFVFTILLFYGLMQLPDEIADKIPNMIFTALYTGVVFIFYQPYLAEKINEKIVESDNKMSNWNVAGLTLLGFIFNMIIIFGIAFYEPAFPGEKITFGQLNNEVFYDNESVSEIEVKKTGEVLTEFGYFQDDYQLSVRIERKLGKLHLILPLQKEYWNETEILYELDMLKKDLKSRVNQDINLVLTHHDLNGNTQTKNI